MLLYQKQIDIPVFQLSALELVKCPVHLVYSLVLEFYLKHRNNCFEVIKCVRHWNCNVSKRKADIYKVCNIPNRIADRKSVIKF
jgi:hypothetical protein